MAMNTVQAAAGGKTAKLVRLLRDTRYHPNGTMLCLEPEHILPDQHEVVEIPTPDPRVDPLTERVAALEGKSDPVEDPRVAQLVEAMTSLKELLASTAGHVADLERRVEELEAAQTPASEPPAEEREAETPPAPAAKTKAKAADAAATT